MPERIAKFKRWFASVFETQNERLTAVVFLFFLIANILKITLFNQVLVPNADGLTFRYKLITTLLLVVITYPILFKLRSRVVFVTFYLLQLIYIIVNMSYYLYFQNYLHIEQLVSNFYEGFTAVQNASAPKSPLLLISLLDLPFFIYLTTAYFKVHQLGIKLRRLVAASVICALFLTGGLELYHIVAKNFLTDIAKNMFLGESRIVQRYGTVVNNAVSIYNSKNTEQYIKSFKYGRQLTDNTEAAKKQNIFIIQIESMDASVVKQQHAGKYIMPFIHSLMDTNVYYPYMLSYHLGGGTSDSEFTAINSIEPLVGYPSIKLTAYKSPNSFIKRLVKAGYEANAFHGNIGRYYNRDLSFHNFGFKTFYDIEKMKMKDVGWGAPDDKVFDFALQKSRRETKPFLTYVITMTSHGPFTNASHYYSTTSYNDIKDTMVKNYFNSMSYVDHAVQTYVESIRKQYDNACIFIYGDHTPRIESNEFKQSSVMIGGKLYEFVPLFIITPDNRKYAEQEKAATFLDIAPTVLAESGVKFSIRSDGANLLKPDEGMGKIPYRGLKWDRSELYDKISAALK